MTSKLPLIVCVLAGLGASLCCVAPLVLLSFGLGGKSDCARTDPTFLYRYLIEACEPGKP